MDPARREELEGRVRGLCEVQDFAAATTALVRAYGPELLGFLVAVHRDATGASDSFSELTEALWRGLPRFGWESSARTWAYAIAGRLALRRKRDAALRARRTTPAQSSLDDLAEQVRTETLSFLKTEKRSRLQELRDSLSEADRALLVLRVDRGLSWNDLARVLGGDEGVPRDEADLARDAARLRKRYQILKDRLRERARREGLL